MQTFPSYYEVGSCSDPYNNFLQGIIMASSSNNTVAEMLMMNNNNGMEEEDNSCLMSPTSMAEAKAIAANKSHSEAERRRRKRINGHLATLRTLLPNAIKTDKASLLAEAVRSVRELKKTATDHQNDVVTMFPSETDELKLSYSAGNLKAAVCCEDRPEIITELSRALKSVEAGKVVRAEMATVGGRIKCVLWLHVEGGGGGDEVVAAVRTALKVVVDRSNAAVNSSQDLAAGTKRQRIYQY